MMATKQSWAKLLGRMLLHGVILGVCVFVAVHAAMAREGERGGHTRTFLTVAGSITVRSDVTPHLTFIFEKVDPLADAGAAPTPTAVCTVTNATTQYNASTGSFSSEIPIDACPGSMFDGANVWVTTVVRDGSLTGAELLRTERRPLNPVPYARYADQYGTPDCPVGYDLDPASPAGRRYCRKNFAAGIADEVVRVGTGATAFWIDRYEARVFRLDASGPVQLGASDDNLGAAFPDNGQWTIPSYAVSARGGPPTRFITWFQASEACRLSGKRLPNGEEWLTAVNGTADPAVGNDGLAAGNTGCNTNSSGGVRTVGGGLACVSNWGAFDMIGNAWEWTSDWYGGLSGGLDGTWPFNGDIASNLTVGASPDGTSPRDRLAAAAIRGGAWNSSTRAGVFALGLDNAASVSSAAIGFRCVIPR